WGEWRFIRLKKDQGDLLILRSDNEREEVLVVFGEILSREW
ncbi:20643_t:CDS:1, partial [Entrophospora sp. SA101]